MATQIELVVITPADISAFVDGELTSEERRDVAACVRTDERAAFWINAWQSQLALLHEAFGRVVEEPVPKRLRVQSRKPVTPRRSACNTDHLWRKPHGQ
jgi:anti-sigma factor RsiW